jgi:hypothetical protein
MVELRMNDAEYERSTNFVGGITGQDRASSFVG